MKTKFLNVFATATILLLATAAVHAQSSYSNEVMSLNPVGYWPMHEVEPAAQGDIETNYGTLGLAGTGYYPDWASGTAKGMTRGYPTTPITGDPDSCVSFLRSITSGSGFSAAAYTNCMFLPHSSPLTTLNPPCSIECWVDITNANHTGTEILGQFGFDNFNGAGTASAAIGYGTTLNWNGEWFIGADNGTTSSNPDGNTTQYPSNQWYYAVITYDAATNSILYINSVAQKAATALAGLYIPDSWTPFTIGGARGGTRAIGGYVADVAIYTTNLSSLDVSNKFNIATNVASVNGQYYNAVIADNPVVFYRMNAATTYTPPAYASLPVLYNYGTFDGAPVGNGAYTAGTMPGILTNQLLNPNGVPWVGVTNIFAELSGVSSFGDAGFAPVYNPTGSNANFSVTAIFRGYPDDGRFTSIVGHGTNSWQLGMSTNGCLVFNAGNGNGAAGGTGNAPGDIITKGVYNDGNWHQVVAVNQTNVISIYVDGQLDTSGTPAGIATTNIIPGNTSDVMIGSDPSYTNNPAGVGRQFAGQICDVAFFTNALTLSQMQALYNNLNIAAYISQQPASAVASQGLDFTNFVTVGGSTPFSYQWYTNGVPIAGQTNEDLILNPVSTNSASTDYYLIVTNLYGSATSAVASLTVYAFPTITAQFPITYTNLENTNFMTLYAGANPKLSLSVLGPSLAYYWITNGVADAVATTSALSFTNVQTGTLNVYCIASNSFGIATSEVWSASIIADPVGAGDAGFAPYPQAVLALNPIAYWRLNDANLEGSDNGSGDDGYFANDYASGNDGIYTNAGIGNGSYNLTTDPSDSSAQFGYAAAPNSQVYDIGTNIDFGMPAGSNAEFSVEAWVALFSPNSGGGIVAKGWGSGGEEFVLDTDAAANGPFRFLVRNAAGTLVSAASTIVPVLNPSPSGNSGNNPTIWYHLVGVCDEAHSNIVLYVNGFPAATASIASGAGIVSDPAVNMTIGARPANGATVSQDDSDDTFQTYGYINDVAVFNYALGGAQVESEYYAGGGTNAPYISPAPQTNVAAGANSTLTIPVTALGTPSIGYLWTNITASATIATGVTNTAAVLNATLNYANVPLSWNGDRLELIVTNAYGATNTFFTLTITNPVSLNPTNIVFSVTNDQLSLSWPADHTGWQLQVQTNSLSVGISTNWVNVSNSTTTNNVIVPINLTNGSVFYRLTY